MVIAERLVILLIIVSRNLSILQIQIGVNKIVIGEVRIWYWDKAIKILEKTVHRVY